MNKHLPPICPGEILLEEFLRPSGLSQNGLAKSIGVPVGQINNIIRGKRAITRDIAARLAVFWSTSPDLWINLQARYDAKLTARDIVPLIAKKIQPHSQNAA